MLWKIYFWLSLVLTILGVLTFPQVIINLSLKNLLSVTLNIILIIAIYSIAFTKQVFSKKWWRIIFWLLTMYFFIGIVIGPKPDIFKASTEEILLLSTFLPAFYAIYKLGYK